MTTANPSAVEADEDWRDVIDTNLMGIVNGVEACYPRMIAQKRGAIATAVAAQERAARLTTDPIQSGGRLLRAAELAFELGQRDLMVRLLREVEQLDLEPLDRGRPSR